MVAYESKGKVYLGDSNSSRGRLGGLFITMFKS